jgi:hypothetical protein
MVRFQLDLVTCFPLCNELQKLITLAGQMAFFKISFLDLGIYTSWMTERHISDVQCHTSANSAILPDDPVNLLTFSNNTGSSGNDAGLAELAEM